MQDRIKVTGELADQLTSESTGRGASDDSRELGHLWDLDRGEHTRMPSGASTTGGMEFDGQPMRVSRVEWWPRVGARSWVWYEDPEAVAATEGYRISSTVRFIERLVDTEGEVNEE